MSYDDYARHIIKKYRLAVSIAVIRSKPIDITLVDHIKQLRDKICEDEMDSDDSRIDICSDDFRIDETDDFGINTDDNDRNNDIIIDDVDKNNDLIVETNNFNHKNAHQDNVNDVEIIDTRDLNDVRLYIDQNSGNTENHQPYNDENDETYHHTEANDVEMINAKHLNDSITVLENFYEADPDMDDMMGEGNSLEDILELNKGIDDNLTPKLKAASTKNPSQFIHNNQFLQTSNRIDITQCSTDNDATLCESICTLPNKHTLKLSQERNYNMDVSNEVLSSMCLNTIRKTEVDTSTSKKETKSNNDTLNDENKSLAASKHIRHYRHTKEFKNVYQNIADIFDTKKNKPEATKAPNTDIFSKMDKSKETPKDSEETVTYTVPDEFLDNTHYSESQDNDFIIMNEKFIHGTNKYNKTSNVKGIHEPNEHNKAEVIKDIEIFSLQTQATNSIPSWNINNENDKCNSDNTNDTQNNKDDKKCTKILKDNDVFSQESLLTNFLTQSTNESQIFDSSNDRNYKEAKDIQRKSAKINIKDKDVVSHESQFTNFFTQSTNDSEIFDSNKEAKDIQRKSAKSSINDKNVFSQESLLTNFLAVSTDSGQMLDNENDRNNKEAKEFPRKSGKSKVKHIDYDLFSQETQLTNFSSLTTNSQNITENSLVFSQDAQNMDEYLDQYENQKSKDEKSNQMSLNKDCTAFDKTFRNVLVTDQIKSCANFDDNLETIQATYKVKSDNNSENTPIMNYKGCADFDSIQITDHSKPCDDKSKNTLLTDGSCTNLDNTLEEMEAEWTESQIELIPFKVIEELNKVKRYINRKFKMSVESGYRSDSQSKYSLEMSQSTGWLNQAAHSLFNYMTECPLVVTTQEVTNEISVVLGELIDKLHEEEKYPSFLEELLETVKSLVGVLYQGTNGQDVLQSKDETTQRILLLNKSRHIQKFTIEKITHILENLHTELCTSDSLYEIKNIDQIENTCYIFHVLEIVLHKYSKGGRNLSQSTQNSQDDEKVLKRSDITDIWRKKWNPNFKNSSNEGSSEKVCALTVCSAVLNKIIVGCMDGYSLISCFALKCFNVMQT